MTTDEIITEVEKRVGSLDEQTRERMNSPCNSLRENAFALAKRKPKLGRVTKDVRRGTFEREGRIGRA